MVLPLAGSDAVRNRCACKVHAMARSLNTANAPCPQVGWAMKAKAGKKKVVLELGGNAACVVEDYRCVLNTA